MIRLLAIVYFYLCPLSGGSQTVRLFYPGSNKTINTAVIIANQIIHSPEFNQKVNEVLLFDNSSYSSKKIFFEMTLCDTIKVNDYKNYFGKTITPSKYDINLNLAKISDELPVLVNTLVHELIHVVDWRINEQWDYNHRKQKNENPPLSAPCVFGKIAEIMAMEILKSI